MTGAGTEAGIEDGRAPRERFLTPEELAERWRMSPRSLERWRADRRGPRWLRLEGRALYRLSDVLAYERARLRGPAD
ncbi:MAG: helix-turn-helix domain-containing protein [Pseudomonadota bacterium]|nr:helix-turn-helix domain-containing protein [Pseudomonadota bacterium]